MSFKFVVIDRTSSEVPITPAKELKRDMALPIDVNGEVSPNPTVVIVCMDIHKAFTNRSIDGVLYIPYSHTRIQYAKINIKKMDKIEINATGC